jgi:hypothetical protein
MKMVHRAATLASLLCAVGWVSLRGQAGAQINISVVTEVTPAGKSAPQASPERPVYYAAHDAGQDDQGIPIGGEEAPAPGALHSALKSALARSGYEPADAAHPPALFLFLRWGSFNREERGFEPLERENLVERAAIVGGAKFGYDVLDAMNSRTLDFFRNRDTRTLLLMQEVSSNLYYLIVSAYDYGAAQRGQRQLLWRTNVATTARGLIMADCIPEFAREAGPYYGRAMTQAAWIETHLPTGQVEIGQPTVIGTFTTPVPENFGSPKTDLEPIPKAKIGLPPF